MFGKSKKYAIELDGFTHSCSKNQIEALTGGLDDLKGDHWIVSDLKEAISGINTVDAGKKYAQMVLQKNIQESGDFDGPVSIISHWNTKKGNNATKIFFTALPTELYNHYIDRIRTVEDTSLVFPLFSVLFSILKKTQPRTPIALVLQHDRFADLIIGTKSMVYYVNRCVAYDTSEEQIENLWQTIKEDIGLTEINNKIQVGEVKYLTWISSHPIPVWAQENLNIGAFEDETMVYQDNECKISFPKAIRDLSGARAITPAIDKAFFYSKRLVPYLNLLMAVAVIFMAAGHFWYQSSYKAAQQSLNALRKKNIEIQKEFKKEIHQKEYKDILAFIKKLDSSKHSLSFKKITNDISAALSFAMELEVLKVDYTIDDITLEIFGRIKAPFKTSHNGYQDFQKSLKQSGYLISESRFDTQIDQSEFLIKLNKRVQ